MPQADRATGRVQKIVLLGLVLIVSLVFLAMIWSFLTAVLLAALVAGLAHPFSERLTARLGGRRTPASVATVILVLLVLVVPLTGLLGVVTAQAVDVSKRVAPAIQRLVEEPDRFDVLLERVPVLSKLAPYRDQLFAKAGDVAGAAGSFIVAKVGAITKSTAAFFLHLFVFLYALFFFLTDGRRILDTILYYSPLRPQEEAKLIGRFVSVTRATLRGTFVVGVVQGALAGLAFAVVGIPAAVFWGAVMAVLSFIPAVGAALVWIPAVIYLMVVGQTGAGIGLALWCALVVGGADNVLRPQLVGKDTEMSDFVILLSTLGGVVLFGTVGVILGPLVAALFVTIWEMYGVAFREYLPEVEPARSDPDAPPGESMRSK